MEYTTLPKILKKLENRFYDIEEQRLDKDQVIEKKDMD